LKIFQTEGISGFYKGWGPLFFREVPHSILCLMFWDQFRILHRKWKLPEDEIISV